MSKSESPILMKFGMNVVFKKIFEPYFLIGNGWRVENYPQSGGAKHILLNISEIIRDIVPV